MADVSKKLWLPLESNPEVMNQFVQGLGMHKDAAFHDVYGFDDDLLAMVPQPVLAVLLLFPINEELEASRAAQQGAAFKETKKVKLLPLLMDARDLQLSDKVYFMKQTVGNACGTIGLLHAIGNNLSQVALEEDSFFKKFFRSTSNMSPEQRAAFLENDSEIETAHSAAASAGDSSLPDINVSVDLHFVCYVTIEGGLYELDGRKSSPVYHGVSSEDTLLKDATKVIQALISNHPQSHNFSVIAFSKGELSEKCSVIYVINVVFLPVV